MGVHGLWRLIEPSGKPVPLETLENKILAVDISIWLHQAIKGFQDSKGATLPNAHLLGIYHRVCKLLYFRIKPVFIFDGGVPFLKKQTIIKRQQQKTKILNEAGNIQTKLLNTLLKHSAVKNVLLDDVSPPKKARNEDKEDIFKLPESQSSELDTTQDSISSSSEDESSSPGKHWDLNTVDVTSEQFRSLPADVRHEILTDLIETRKQSSWGRLHELPSHSGEFSQFQMKRLLTRNSVQVSLEEAKQEMGGHTLSLGELEALLTEEGIVEASKNNTNHRIASNENTRYLLMKDIQKEMENALKRENSKIQTNLDLIPEVTDEFQDDLALAIQLSLQQNESSTSKEDISSSTQNQPSTSEQIIILTDQVISSSVQNEPSTSKDIRLKQNLEHNESSKSEERNSPKSDLDLAIQLSIQEASKYEKNTIKQLSPLPDDNQPTTSYSYLEHFNDEDFMSDSESDGGNSVARLAQAKSYMVEYSDLTPNEIEKILKNSTTTKPNITLIEKEVTRLNNNKTDQEIEQKPIVKQIENILSSDSEDSDFIEIPDHLNSTSTNQIPKMEIVINPSETIQDDLFSDIFENITTNEINKTVVEKNENKIVIVDNEPIDIINDKAVENDTMKEENNIMFAEDNITLIPQPKLTVHELNTMKRNLENDREELLQERNTKERMAANITDQMYQEAQELLELFGVPYVIAPMEAEAQCAFLNEINLTDGTITDDSDIWLFGGRTVYKNFFNHNKHVLEFRTESIEHHFKLTREQMILLALLVGSDYTLGIQGIGPVTALEILASFPPSRHANVNVLTQDELISGLTEFRKWLHDGKIVGVGRTTLRSKLRNVNVSEGFPSLQIVQAYLEPKVETCAEKFTWSKPDVVGLIDFAREKFGWTKFKSEEILKPVMKKVEDKNIQKSIQDYFATKRQVDTDLENKLSKRVKSAVKKMGKKNDDSSQDEDIPKPKRKPVPKKSKKQTTTTNEEPTSSKPDETGKNIKPKKSKPPSDQVETLKSTRKTTTNQKPEDLHAKEYIPQKERDKINALKNKLKAIEVFRKSKQGPGFMKKRSKINRPLKEEAELSESSESN